MSREFFRKFAAEELFTEYIFELMKARKSFMVFVDNKQVLVDEEVDEWNIVNGILNSTERLIYHPLSNGYVVTHTGSITNVLTPFDAMKNGYEEFIKSTNEE